MRVSIGLRSRLSRCVVAVAVPLVFALPLAALTFAPATAFAQDADIAQARQLGQQAQSAYDAGNYAESEKLWAAAAKLYSAAPTLTLGLARTQAKLGKFVAAQESYNRIVREWGTVASPPPAFKDALDAAKAEVGLVSAKVGTVVVTVEGPTAPVVTIDGQSVPAAALGLKRPVDPGTHAVKASAEGYKPAETAFTVPEGGSVDAKLKMEKSADVGVAPVGPVGGNAATTEPPAGDTGSKGGSTKTLALVAFGVGGAGLVVGAITGLLAIGKHGDLNDKCPDGRCPASEQSNVDSYKTMGTISTIGFIVAGVGGITGAVLLFTAPKETASAARSRYATVPVKGVTMTPYLGATSVGLSGRF